MSVQGARAPVSKSPFFTIGVAAAGQLLDVAVTVATTVVTTVVAGGVAVRMQEQALLSLDAGYVVMGTLRLALPAGVTVVLHRY